MPYIGYDPSAPGTISIQRFTAGTDFTAGTTTSLTITYSPGSANNIDIYFDGQYQHHDQWSISGNTITFTAAIPVGTAVVEVKYGNSVAIGTPADGAVTLAKLASQTLAGLGQALLINGKITTSVAANALTVAVKTDAGNDPSSSDPVYVYFRKSTLTDSGFDRVAITAALSVVVSSGSTLGHASAIAQHIFVYLVNNAGTAELAVSNLPPDYPGTFGKARLVSTTAEGGAGAADSATAVYSTTARSNVPWICVAKMLSTQTTAGTWASNMTQVDQAPFATPVCPVFAYRSGNQTISDNTLTKAQVNAETFDPDSVFDSSTNYRFQPNVAGYYRVTIAIGIAEANDGGLIGGYIYKNGSQVVGDEEPASLTSGGSSYSRGTAALVLLNGADDYLELYVYQNRGSAATLQGTSNRTNLTAIRATGGY